MFARLRIAHRVIEIDCAAPACESGVAALIALFPRATHDSPADLRFSFTCSESLIHLACNNERLWQSKDAGEVIAAFEWAFYNRTIAMLYPEFISLHAACVGMNGHAIIFAGKSGSGKSSLCTAALLDGFDYFSDEYTLPDAEGRIHAFPRPLQWGATTHPAFDADGMLKSGLFSQQHYAFTDRDGKPVTSLLWHPKHVAESPAEPLLLVLPQFSATAKDAGFETVPRSQALLELAAEMHHKLPAGQRVQALHQRLPEHLPCVRLHFSDVHHAWQKIRRMPETHPSAD